MQQFLGDPESGLFNWEGHHLALAILKKPLDENHFWTTQRTMDREPPSFKIYDSLFQKQTTRQMDLKWRHGYSIVHIKCNRHYLHIVNQATGKQDHATSKM